MCIIIIKTIKNKTVYVCFFFSHLCRADREKGSVSLRKTFAFKTPLPMCSCVWAVPQIGLTFSFLMQQHVAENRKKQSLTSRNWLDTYRQASVVLKDSLVLTAEPHYPVNNPVNKQSQNISIRITQTIMMGGHSIILKHRQQGCWATFKIYQISPLPANVSGYYFLPIRASHQSAVISGVHGFVFFPASLPFITDVYNVFCPFVTTQGSFLRLNQVLLTKPCPKKKKRNGFYKSS